MMKIDYSKKPIFIFNKEAKLNRDYASLSIVRSDNEDVYLKFITPLREVGGQLLMVVGEKRFGFKVSEHPLDEELVENSCGGFDLLIKTILCPVRTGEANTYCFESKQEQNYVLESVKDAVAYDLITRVVDGERRIVKNNYGRFPREVEQSIQAGKYLCNSIKKNQ